MLLNLQKVIFEQDESIISGEDSGIGIQDTKRGIQFDSTYEISLRCFDMNWINEKGELYTQSLYLSDQNIDFYFQYAFMKMKGFSLKHPVDLELMLGLPSSIPTKLNLTNILQEKMHYEDHKIKRMPFQSYLGSIAQLIKPVESIVLSPDSFYPNTIGFTEEDYKDLEAYIESNPALCFNRFAKGVIKRHREIEDSSDFRKGASEYCHQSTSVWLRILAQGYRRMKVEGKEKQATETFDLIIDTFHETVFNTGIYYCTQIDKKDNHASIIFNMGVILDCCPEMRKPLLKKLDAIFRLIDGKELDLFELEKHFWAGPSLFKSLLLYLCLETEQCSSTYFKSLRLLEYLLTLPDTKPELSLFLGDIYETNLLSQEDSSAKQMQLYLKAYTLNNPYTSLAALSRLTVLYQRNFQMLLLEGKAGETTLINFYKEILDAHKILARTNRRESMKFLLNHYFKCYCYVTGENQVTIKPQRAIENLLLNRRLSLQETLPLFDFFCTMGEREEILEHYFSVLRYLSFMEAGLVAMRLASLAPKEIAYSKRFLPYAICKQEGLGLDKDLVYSARLYKYSFMETTSELRTDKCLESAIFLYKMAYLFAPFRNSDRQHLVDQLAEHSLNFLVHADEFKRPTKKYLYYFAKTLHLAKGANLFSGKSNSMNEAELFVDQIITHSFNLEYTTTEDFTFHYLIEKSIYENLYPYESLDNIDSTDSEYLEELHHFHSKSDQKKIEKSHEIIDHHLETLKLIITKADRAQFSLSYVENSIIPLIGQCIAVLEVTSESPEALASKALKAITPSRLSPSKKKHTALITRESLFSKSTNYQLNLDLERMSKLMMAKDFQNRFNKRLKAWPNVRMIDEMDIEVEGEGISMRGYNQIKIKKGHFKKNSQSFREFEFELKDWDQVERFFQNFYFFFTSSPFFLNYYGLYTTISSNQVKLHMVTEYFDEFCVNNEGQKVWASKSLTTEAKFDLFHDLLLAVQALHFVGKPHLILCTSLMVTCKQNSMLKLIIPFFADFYTNMGLFMGSASLEDAVYFSPNIYKAQIFPQREFDVLISESPEQIHQSFLKSDIWSLAVVFLEIITCSSFTSSQGIKSLVEYIGMASKKSRVNRLVDRELAIARKLNPNSKFPWLDLKKMTEAKNLDRPGVNRVVQTFEDIFVQQGLSSRMLEAKKKKEYYYESVFTAVSFCLDQSMDSDRVDELRGNRTSVILLPNNLEYIGETDNDSCPDGSGGIQCGRHIKIEGIFKAGQPLSKCRIHKDNGLRLFLERNEKGEVLNCSISNLSSLISDEKIAQKILVSRLMINEKLIQGAFEKYLDQKYLDLQQELQKTEVISKEEASENYLEGVASLLVGKIQIERKLKKSITKQTISFEEKQRLLMMDIEASSDEENKIMHKGESIESVILKRKEERLKNKGFMLAANYVKMLCQTSNSKNVNQKLPSTDYLRGNRQESETKVFYDPFGFIYEIGYNAYLDRVDYAEGFVRSSTRLDSFHETLVFNPQSGLFLFLLTDLFETKLLDCPRSIRNFKQLYAMSMFEQNFDYCISTDCYGNHLRGVVRGGRMIRGLWYSKNKIARIKHIKADLYNCHMINKDDHVEKGCLEYQGMLSNYKYNGPGILKEVKGDRKVNLYEGHFENGVPHGYCTMFDNTGGTGPESFTGYFNDGIKFSGKIEDNNEISEGIFTPELNKYSNFNDYSNALKFSEIHETNSHSFEGIGWTQSKQTGVIKYGKFFDSDNTPNGIYKIIYQDGSLYKGKFSQGNRTGPFIMITKTQDAIIGDWDMGTVIGVILWNSKSPMKYSKGKFQLNSNGELEQGNFGVVSMRDGSEYRGQLNNNQFQGFGKLSMSDGSYYQGAFQDGLYHGVGELFKKSTGTIIRGNFECGQPSGSCIVYTKEVTLKCYFVDRECRYAYIENFQTKIYEKEVSTLISSVEYNNDLDIFELSGICLAQLSEPLSKTSSSFSVKLEYEGSIQKGSITGNGVLIRGDEYVYEGSFVEGYLSGHGRLNIRPKMFYLGEFDKNVAIGYGQIKEKNILYEGQFKNLMMSGTIIVYNKREKWMIVEYKKDQKHGYCFMNLSATPIDLSELGTSDKRLSGYTLEHFKHGHLIDSISVPTERVTKF